MPRSSYLAQIGRRAALDVPALRPPHPLLHRWVLADRAKTIGATIESYQTDAVAIPRTPRAEVDASSLSITDRPASLRLGTGQSHLATAAAPSNTSAKTSASGSSTRLNDLKTSSEHRADTAILVSNPPLLSRSRNHGEARPQNYFQNLATPQATESGAHPSPRPQTAPADQTSELPRVVLLPSPPASQSPTRFQPEARREPSVRIGTIDIHIDSPPVPIAAPRPAQRAAASHATAPLARPLINSFGLRQG
jgi:hypothetical protein